MDKLPLQETLTDEHLKAIALVIAQWNYMEGIIKHALYEVATGISISTMTDTDGIALGLVTGMDVKTQIGILKAVFRARHKEGSDEFDKMLDKIDNDRKVRNTVAHTRWRKGNRPNSIITYTFKSTGELTVDPHDYTPEELTEAAHRIFNRAGALWKFLLERGHLKRPDSASLETQPGPAP